MGELIAHSSAVHTRRKSRWAPSDVTESIVRAMHALRTCSSVVPVLHEGEAIGLARGDAEGRWVDYVPVTYRQWCGFNTYNDLKTALNNGHGTRAQFKRDTSGWGTNSLWGDAWPVTGGGLGVGDYSGTANTARLFDNTTPGNLWRDGTKAASLETRHFAGWRMGHIPSGGGAALSRQYILYDRVLAYDGVSISSTITNFTNTLTAARYISTGQDGLYVSPSCTAATGATASAISSLKFTDDQGNTGVSLTASLPLSWATSFSAPTASGGAGLCAPYDTVGGRTMLPWLPLGGTVKGVRKLESLTSSVSNTGTVTLACLKPVGTLWCNNTNMFTETYLAKTMFTLERIFDDSCLSFLFFSGGSSTAAIQGHMEYAQG